MRNNISKFSQNILRHTNAMDALIELAYKIFKYDNRTHLHNEDEVEKTINAILIALYQLCKDNRVNKEYIYKYHFDFILKICKKKKFFVH